MSVAMFSASSERAPNIDDASHMENALVKRKKDGKCLLSSIDDKTKRKTAFEIKINIAESLLMD